MEIIAKIAKKMGSGFFVSVIESVATNKESGRHFELFSFFTDCFQNVYVIIHVVPGIESVASLTSIKDHADHQKTKLDVEK